MKKLLKNYAFIDSQNLNLEIQRLGWKLDIRKFRIYLRDKYQVKIAYLFLGYIPKNQDLYQSLQKAGYVLIFKEVLKYRDGSIKGNVDAELVLQAMIDFSVYEKAVIVSGDGDFACLVKYLAKHEKLEKCLVPNIEKYSALLKKAARNKLGSMNNLKKKLEYIKKRTL